MPNLAEICAQCEAANERIFNGLLEEFKELQAENEQLKASEKSLIEGQNSLENINFDLKEQLRALESKPEPIQTDRINHLENIAFILGNVAKLWAVRWDTLPGWGRELINAYDKLQGQKRDQVTGEIVSE
jgi:DNA repair ATPase RecN